MIFVIVYGTLQATFVKRKCIKCNKDMNQVGGPLEWKEEYNVNISFIDEHHQKFLNILNNLQEVVHQDNCSERISEIYFSLVHYAEHYLIREAMYFKEYPNFIHHQDAHKEFINRVTKLQRDFEAGKKEVCSEMYQYLLEWFQNHILKYDKEAVNYLKSKGLV